MSERLKVLRDYFPTAIYTGRSLLFISEETRVELTEQPREGFGGQPDEGVIRVRLSLRTAEGSYESFHYEDFEIASLADLAGEIEKFVQHAVGKNLREPE